MFADLAPLKPRYTTADNLLNSFLLPVLQESEKCSMSVGYFSSNGVYELKSALEKIIEREGKIKIIASPQLSPEDYECLRHIENDEKAEGLISKAILESLTNISYPLELLAYLYKNNYLELKLALFHAEEEDFEGVFHTKCGVFEDGTGNMVTWEGSLNCTKGGFGRNFESASVSCSWESHRENLASTEIKKQFELMWGGEEKKVDSGLSVFKFPEACKEKLLKIAPNDLEELGKSKVAFEKLQNNFNIWPARDYQINAVNGWLGKSKEGVFEMATGTGKTFAGLYASVAALARKETIHEGNEFQVDLKTYKNFLLVVVVPYNHLLLQWRKDCEDFGYACLDSETNRTWKADLATLIPEDASPHCLLLTYATFANPKTHSFLKGLGFSEKMLLADEVHHFGEKRFLSLDIEHFGYKLGLSATPNRMGDPVGTNNIFEKIGPNIESAKYTLKEAIQGRPPDHEQFLCTYTYNIRTASFTEEEQEQYNALCLKITQASMRKSGDYTSPDFDSESKGLGALLGQRLRLIGSASNKLGLLRQDIISLQEKLGSDFKNVLIYCGPDMWDDCESLLTEREIKFTSITFEDAKGTHAAQNRAEKLKEFGDGSLPVMMAKKCLDEGLNVPSAKYAFILQHTTNEMEFIQRRGRVLRMVKPHKTHAEITDYVVVPYMDSQSQKLGKYERKLVERELHRMKDFANTCNNTEENYNKVYALEGQLLK
jgi:superfamily II DNA or RNA helicase/HKD family nuclease